MPEETLQQKIEQARQAMTGGTNSASPSLLVGALAERRKTTLQPAPTNTTSDAALSPEALAKKRAEARRAMESFEQKKRREMREQAEIEARATTEKIAELKQARIKLEEKRASDAALGKAEILAGKVQAETTYQTRLAESRAVAQSIIEKPDVPVDTYRTLRTDVHEQVSTGGLTMTKIALEEEARRRLNNLPREDARRPRSYAFIAAGSLVLVLIGIGTLVATRIIITPTQTTLTPFTINSIIFADYTIALPTDNTTTETLRTTLGETLSKSTRPDTITNLYPTKIVETEEGRATELVPATTFLTKLGLTLPNGFTHFLENRFMVGVVSPAGATSSAPFYILTTRSFENTLDSLLREENMIMSNLLAPFLDPTETATIQTGTFRDVILGNIDTRIMSDSSGRALVVYGFLDRNTLAITASREAFMRLLTAYRTPSPETTTP